MALSALDDKDLHPTTERLAGVLGASVDTWQDLVGRMEANYGPLTAEWNFSGAKYGWSCRLRQKKRNIIYLIPQDGSFLVGIVLGDRALGLLRRDDVSPGALALIDSAPRYGEGTGFRLPVTSPGDLRDIEVVMAAKMA